MRTNKWFKSVSNQANIFLMLYSTLAFAIEETGDDYMKVLGDFRNMKIKKLIKVADKYDVDFSNLKNIERN